MSLNCIEIEELVKTFPKEGIIKKFYQPDKFSLIINYMNKGENFFLFISVMDGYNRIYMIENLDEEKIQNRFSNFLNANFFLSKIKNIFQYNYSRVVVIEIENNNKLHKLLIRMWGNGGNIILIDENNYIVECLRRLPKRKEWPKEQFDLSQIKPPDNIFQYAVREEFKNSNINKAVNNYFKKQIEEKNFNEKKNKLLEILEEKFDNFKKKLLLMEENVKEENFHLYKKYGDLLIANIHLIKKGLTEISVMDYESEKLINIPLQPELSPQENVEKYYEKYKKLKNKRDLLLKEKENLLLEIQNLEKKIKLLHNTEDLEQFTKIEQSLNKASFVKAKKDEKNFGRQIILDNKFLAIISRSDKEADMILSRIAKGNDYWFHIRDYPGSHVIVKRVKGIEITEKAKEQAAMLAAYFSKAKNEECANVFFTLVKYLHKPKGGKPGLVFPKEEKNIFIKIDKKLVESLLRNNTMELYENKKEKSDI